MVFAPQNGILKAPRDVGIHAVCHHHERLDSVFAQPYSPAAANREHRAVGTPREGKIRFALDELAPFEVVLAKKGEEVKKSLSLAPKVKAPVSRGQALGKLTLEQGGRVIAEVDIVASRDVGRLSYGGILSRVLRAGLLRG